MGKSMFALEFKRMLLAGAMWALVLFVWGAGISIFIVLCVQGVVWLRTAVWKPFPLSELLQGLGIAEVYTHLLGLQKIIDLLLGTPALVWVGATALVAFVISVIIGEAVTNLDREILQRKKNLEERR
jgi:hypothetical protein